MHAGNVGVEDNNPNYDCNNGVVGSVNGTDYPHANASSSPVLQAMADFNTGFADLSACPVTATITADRLASGAPFTPGVYKVMTLMQPQAVHSQTVPRKRYTLVMQITHSQRSACMIVVSVAGGA